MRILASATGLAALAALAGSMLSPPAHAAPFCIQNQVLPPQCIYYDAQECQREANRQNAACSANPNEFKLTNGNGRFCVITSSQISLCSYADRQSCATDAARQNGTCVDSPRYVSHAPDPYSAVEGN